MHVFFQPCPYSVFSARSQNTPDKTEAPSSVLILEANSPSRVSGEQNMEPWHRDCSVCGKLEFLRTVAFFRNSIFLYGGRFALFYCSSLRSSSGLESLGMLQRLQPVLSRQRAVALQLQAGSKCQVPPAPSARLLLAAGGEQDVPRSVRWVCACPAKLGFGRCMQKLSNWFKNICWVIEKEEQASPQGSE